MPSTFTNLRRQLKWADFGVPRPTPDPPPGVLATAAQTRATHSHSFHVEAVPGTKPPQFRLKDDATVSVILMPGGLFVNAWVFRQPTSFQDSLLHHEQGHYDLVALFCRDMFIEMMALKSQTSATAADALQAVQKVFGRFDPLIKAVHDPYDTDTKHGREPAQQKRWDDMIQKSFTVPRTPAVNAPDGTPYKQPLLDCLRAGGVKI
jgi:hypothetical protein